MVSRDPDPKIVARSSNFGAGNQTSKFDNKSTSALPKCIKVGKRSKLIATVLLVALGREFIF